MKYSAQVVEIIEPCVEEREKVPVVGVGNGVWVERSGLEVFAAGAGTTPWRMATCECRTATTQAGRTRIATTMWGVVLRALLKTENGSSSFRHSETKAKNPERDSSSERALLRMTIGGGSE